MDIPEYIGIGGRVVYDGSDWNELPHRLYELVKGILPSKDDDDIDWCFAATYSAVRNDKDHFVGDLGHLCRCVVKFSEWLEDRDDRYMEWFGKMEALPELAWEIFEVYRISREGMLWFGFDQFEDLYDQKGFVNCMLLAWDERDRKMMASVFPWFEPLRKEIEELNTVKNVLNSLSKNAYTLVAMITANDDDFAASKGLPFNFMTIRHFLLYQTVARELLLQGYEVDHEKLMVIPLYANAMPKLIPVITDPKLDEIRRVVFELYPIKYENMRLCFSIGLRQRDFQKIGWEVYNQLGFDQAKILFSHKPFKEKGLLWKSICKKHKEEGHDFSGLKIEYPTIAIE